MLGDADEVEIRNEEGRIVIEPVRSTDTSEEPDPVLGLGQDPVSCNAPDAVVAAINATLESFPDLRPEVTNLFADGEQAVAEVVRRGTNTGELTLPSGSVPPTGRDVRLPECIIFRVRDGKVVSMTAYVDRLHVMEELGVAPQTEDPSHSDEAL